MVFVLDRGMKPRCRARYHISPLPFWKMGSMHGASTSGCHSNQMIVKCYVNTHEVIILCEIIKKYFGEILQF